MSTNWWVGMEMWYINTIEFHSVKKKGEIMDFVGEIDRTGKYIEVTQA